MKSGSSVGTRTRGRFSKSGLVAAGLLAMLSTVPGQSADGGQEAALIAVLKSDADHNAKADACRDLVRVGTAAAVPVLAPLLADEKLAHMARYGLERIPGPEVDAALRDALGRLKGRQLVGVIGSIGARRDKEAAAALAGLLKDPDAETARAAARALGSIGTAQAAASLQAALAGASGENLLALCEGLFRCAEAAVAEGGNDRAIAIFDLLRQLPAPPHQVRAGAWRGAIMARGKDGTALLLEAFRGNDPGLATIAVGVALELEDAGLSKTLADELAASPAGKQVLLANVLGGRGDAAAMPALLGLAKAGDKDARVAAIRALVEIGDAGAAAPLAALLMDPEAEVAQAAAAGLAGLSGAAVDEVVVNMLATPDQALRLKLVETARQRRIAGAMPALVRMMDDTDGATRSAAIRSYAEIGGEAGFAELLARLVKSGGGGDAELLGKSLVSICGASGQAGALVPGLLAALSQAGPGVKPALLGILRVAGGAEALAALRGAVNDPDKTVHTAAIRVLGEWRTPDALPVLLELAKGSGEPVDRILSLRGCLGIAARADVPAPDRLAACRQSAPLIERDDEKRLLLGALGGLADAGSLDLVVPFLDQPGVKNEAVATVMAVAEKRPARRRTSHP